jgi:phage terminase large subunit-like protein
MKKHYAQSCDAALLSTWTTEKLDGMLAGLSLDELAQLSHDWLFWSRPQQRAPEGDWRTWVFMGGRGAGKTRAGAEWVSHLARYGHAGRIALIGPTFHDVREVMIEGRSGVRGLAHERPHYEASRRRLIWANGAQAFAFSAEDPESLRGPQFDAAWADEMCFWSYADETLDTLEHAMRLGERPQLMVTTTPRPTKALKRLLAASDTALSQASTWDNAKHLAAGFIDALRRGWVGSARQRQEVLGEMVDNIEGALWKRADIEAARTREHGEFDRIVVAVDPPAGSGPNAAHCGIVAAAAWGEGWERSAMVLADASLQGAAPNAWANQAASLARSLGAHAIVAEANNGGDMVRAVLQAAAPEIFVRLVRASEGKRARAEPIATFYAQGRVKHAAAFPALEDEMCSFGAEDFKHSPDRLDALVWALTDLLMNGAQPRLRLL